MRNDLPTNPPGVQLPIATSPPARHTRSNSEATRSGRGANIAPNIESTTSNWPFSYGSCSASPSTKEIFRSSLRARSFACSSRLGAMSRPTTSAPVRAAGTDWLPVPQATSSTRMPGCRPRRPTNPSAERSLIRAIWPKSPAIQVDFMRCLRAINSGESVTCHPPWRLPRV